MDADDSLDVLSDEEQRSIQGGALYLGIPPTWVALFRFFGSSITGRAACGLLPRTQFGRCPSPRASGPVY